MYKSNNRSDKKGFSLIGLLTAVGISGIVLLVLSQIMTIQNRASNGLKLVVNRDMIVSWLDRSLADSRTLDRTAAYSGTNSAGNLAFRYCYSGTTGISPAPACAPNCCVVTTSSDPQPFNILDPRDPNGSSLLAGTQASTVYSGQNTSDSPARFDMNGARCTSASLSCPLEAYSSYIADCGGPSTCAKAYKLRIQYTVKIANDPTTSKPFSIPGGANLAVVTKTVLYGSGMPTQLSADAIAVGGKHACAITHGTLKCWGSNSFGELGDGTNTDRSIPTQVSGFTSDVYAVVAGEHHTCALRSGKVWCWGKNSAGQLGTGDTINSNVPVQLTAAALSKGAQQLATHANHTCALTGGRAWCWGDNSMTQLGNMTAGGIATSPVQVMIDAGATTPLTSAQAVVAGHHHSCALVDGKVYCWGRNASGQLGNNANVNSPIPVSVNEPAGPNPFTDVVSLTAGNNHNCARSSGNLYCWGDNSFGALGVGGGGDKWMPTQVSTLTATQLVSASIHKGCAIANGQLYCWGSNSHGQLGINNSSNQNAPQAVLDPTTLAPMTGVTAVAENGETTCAIVSGKVWCWGHNDRGQLGNGSPTTTDSWLPSRVIGS